MKKGKNKEDDIIEKLIEDIIERTPRVDSEGVDTKGEKEILDAISKLDVLFEINIAMANTSEARLALDRRMELVNELRLMRES